MRSDTRNLRIKILRLILQTSPAGGTYNKALSDALGLQKQVVNYHLRGLEKQGLIIVTQRSAATMYSITDAGKDWLKRVDSDILTGKNMAITGVLRELPRFDNIHNLQYKAPVRRKGLVFLPNKADINGWTRRWGFLKGCNIEETTQSIVFRFQVEADDEYKAADKAQQVLDTVIFFIEEHCGYDLGRATRSRTPHHTTIGDPIADTLKQQGDIVYVNDEQGVPVGHFDASHDRGEAELYTAQDSENFRNGFKAIVAPDEAGRYMLGLVRTPGWIKEMRDAIIARDEILTQIKDILRAVSDGQLENTKALDGLVKILTGQPESTKEPEKPGDGPGGMFG